MDQFKNTSQNLPGGTKEILNESTSPIEVDMLVFEQSC
jgi:hypothetical protein